MVEAAQQKAIELGIENSLQRRYAVMEDITINNVLFADRSAKKAMNAFDKLSNSVPTQAQKFDRIEEVDIETFIKDILPKASSVELLVENKHQNNLMSLIAPMDSGAKPIFKWDNNFSWAYNGEVADSMRERVKKAGGKVDGVLRFSIQWNDGDKNPNDFDAHCVEPDGNRISFRNKRGHASSGMLDVDIMHPTKDVAVENITWSDKRKMQEGEYCFFVHNFRHRGGRTGFTAEIEYDGVVHSFAYTPELRRDQTVTVAKISFTRAGGIKFISALDSTTSSKQVWGVPTQKFHPVSLVMNSPNHWDGRTTGNKHYFFILQGCKQEGSARGFFNEFLNEELTPHRKVFEHLGAQMRVDPAEHQLSGLGFSSTQRNQVVCKVAGSFTRTIKINF